MSYGVAKASANRPDAKYDYETKAEDFEEISTSGMSEIRDLFSCGHLYYMNCPRCEFAVASIRSAPVPTMQYKRGGGVRLRYELKSIRREYFIRPNEVQRLRFSLLVSLPPQYGAVPVLWQLPDELAAWGLQFAEEKSDGGFRLHGIERENALCSFDTNSRAGNDGSSGGSGCNGGGGGGVVRDSSVSVRGGLLTASTASPAGGDPELTTYVANKGDKPIRISKYDVVAVVILN